MAQRRKRSANSAKLASLIRTIRLDAGDSLKGLAPRLDVDYSYLSKIENGVTTPSSSFLARFAREYDVDVDTLFLAAGRLPPDIEQRIRENPHAVMALVRAHFSRE